MASELQVNTITEATSGSGITFAKDIIPATPLSHRNMIINGGMNVSQRYGTSGASLSGSNTGDYTVDRFALIIGSSYNLDTTTTQVSGDPNETGQSKALKIECDTVQNPSSTHNGGVFTKLEGQDLQRLLYGTASAKNSVLTFWAKAGGSGAGQYTCQIKYLKSGPTYYVQYHTFTLTTSWQKFTINLNANGTATSQPIIDDNTAGMEIYWWLVAGSSDLVSASSTWTAGDSTYKAVTGQTNFMADTSNEFYLTGVQLELGSVATPFEHRSFGEELARCQRYYQNFERNSPSLPENQVSSIGAGIWYTTNQILATFDIYTVKRATPTLTVSSADWAYYYGSSLGQGSNDSSSPFDVVTPNTARINIATSSSQTAGWGTHILLNDNETIEVNAEL